MLTRRYKIQQPLPCITCSLKPNIPTIFEIKPGKRSIAGFHNLQGLMKYC